MPSRQFVHLHLHTQFSLLDGAIKIKELPEYARKLGYEAVAITDHGNLFGSYKFYAALKEAGLKPIIGMEAYITKGSRFNKVGKGSEDNYTDNQNHHIVLIAKNDTGFRNLMKLSSIGYLEGFHYKPRIDLEVLNEHREGLICLTACLKGLPTYYAARGEEREAERWLLKLLEIFGKEDLYVELQPHDLEEQITANRVLVKLAKKHGLKLVATCDVHYLRPEDKVAHTILTALQMKKTYKELLQSPQGRKLQKLELHFASPEEVWRRFENKFDGWEEALLNTLEVAEKVDDRLEYFENKEYKMPVYEVPEGETLESYFRKLAVEGLKRRLKERGAAKDERVYWERLEYEMEVISKMGFPGYFLIVQDFINWAKKNGIPVGPGRGSAGGSLVAYALGITDIDPIKHDLLFERFLNPDRVSMPDIDVDFCMERRDDVIEYVANKYGRDSVSQIITYNVLKSKSVIRDVCRALGVPLEKADRLAKLIPQGETQGSQLSLEEMTEWSMEQLREKYGERPDIEDAVQKFRRMIAEDPALRQAVEIGKKLDGLTRHTGFHAAGVVIAPKPLIELVPLYARKEKDKETKKEKFVVATQYDMGVLEEIGLLKMDFLGLKTL
ncbi:MAG: DNA polymerase III subunit alpha, partial [Aquificae bacterium]|nr:DNA polymerase III subunit alpha [Aquificota bacterium]